MGLFARVKNLFRRKKKVEEAQEIVQEILEPEIPKPEEIPEPQEPEIPEPEEPQEPEVVQVIPKQKPKRKKKAKGPVGPRRNQTYRGYM